jgi:lysozyme
VILDKSDLPPVLDIEVIGNPGAAKLRQNIRIWLNVVEKHYGMKPIIYSYIDFYEKYIYGTVIQINQNCPIARMNNE